MVERKGAGVRSHASPSERAGVWSRVAPFAGHPRSRAGAWSPRQQIRSTTVVAVRHRDQVAVAGDGQVSIGNTIVKAGARKVRKLYGDRVVAGFAGAAADAFTLFARFEAKLEEHRGNLSRAAVELAKDWRSDRVLRRLEALLAVADREHSFIVSGTGDVIAPDDGLIGVGSRRPAPLRAGRGRPHTPPFHPQPDAADTQPGAR